MSDLIARIRRAEQEVSDLCSGKRRWTMSVPAELDRDSDLLIGGALGDARKALAASQAVLDVIDRFVASTPNSMALHDFYGNADGIVAVEHLRTALEGES